MTPREAIPQSWTDHLTDGDIGLGLDLATSDKKTSNPSSLTVTQKIGRQFKTRFNVSWKTDDPAVTTAICELILDDLLKIGKKAKRLSIDASNEVFFAKELKKKFSKYCQIKLIKSGQNIKHDGHELDAKTLIGNIYINLIEDGLLDLPNSKFLFDDHRLVKRDRGSFTTETGKNGQHGDTFDSGKLSVWSLIKGGGSVSAQAVDTSGKAHSKSRPGLMGPISKGYRNKQKINT